MATHHIHLHPFLLFHRISVEFRIFVSLILQHNEKPSMTMLYCIYVELKQLYSLHSSQIATLLKIHAKSKLNFHCSRNFGHTVFWWLFEFQHLHMINWLIGVRFHSTQFECLLPCSIQNEQKKETNYLVIICWD